MSAKPTLTRKKHKKSKLGCAQCKTRRIKCDETLPSCEKCLGRSIRCAYLDYSPSEIQKIQLAHWEAANVGSLNSLSIDQQKVIFGGTGVSESSPISIPSLSRASYSSASESSPQTVSYKIPLVRHQGKIKPFNDENYPFYFGETTKGVTSRYLILDMTRQRIEASFRIPALFYSHLIVAAGVLLRTNDESIDTFYYYFRGHAMNRIIKQLSHLNDSNVLDIYSTINVLNSSSVYMKRKMSDKDNFYLTSGPGMMLESAFKEPLKFPKSMIYLTYLAESLLFTANFVWFPQYNKRVLWEFYDTLKEFGEKYITSEDYFNDEDVIYTQYESLLELMDFCVDMLENNQTDSEVLKYPINKVIEMIQKWYAIIPSECFTLGSHTPPVEKVFYVFWFALMHLLDSIIIGARYIFTYFLDGFHMIYPFKKEEILRNMTDEQLIWYTNYNCRLIAFFTRRTSYIIRNSVLKNPIPAFPTIDDRMKPRPLEIQERCITSFRDTVIKKINYPIGSSKSENLVDSTQENYYKPLRDDYSSSGDDDTTVAELLEGLNTELSQNEDVDLIGNVNPDTSLLRNDYDPRYIDPIFSASIESIRTPNLLESIANYVEDRRLVITAASKANTQNEDAIEQ